MPLPKASVSDLRSSTDSIRDTDLMAVAARGTCHTWNSRSAAAPPRSSCAAGVSRRRACSTPLPAALGVRDMLVSSRRQCRIAS